jgi:hypothetical protein
MWGEELICIGFKVGKIQENVGSSLIEQLEGGIQVFKLIGDRNCLQ